MLHAMSLQSSSGARVFVRVLAKGGRFEHKLSSAKYYQFLFISSIKPKGWGNCFSSCNLFQLPRCTRSISVWSLVASLQINADCPILRTIAACCSGNV